ncbi:MAG: hypothetical protein J5825_06005 [Lachnospiraceae bacterium]|nr:hypothetical protein [Lachnospiraceae bacterium]
MAIPSWCKQEITIIRPGTATSRGSSVYDWSNPTSWVVSNCSVQPASTGLSQDGRVLGINEGYTVYLPPGTDVKAGDRVEFEGETYTILGRPKPWVSATGAVSHIQLSIERWSG